MSTDDLVDTALDVALRRRGLDPANLPPAAEQALAWLGQTVEALAPALHGDPASLRALAAGFDAWAVGLDSETVGR